MKYINIQETDVTLTSIVDEIAADFDEPMSELWDALE